MNTMMEYKGYRAVITYDADDDIFVGEVVGIADSLNFHGTSVAEMKEMFHESIDNYLDLCAEIGKEPEREYKGQFNVRIDPGLHRDAAMYAAQEHISLNQAVARGLEILTGRRKTEA